MQFILKLPRLFGGGIAGLQQTCGYLTGSALAYTLIFDAKSELFKVRMSAINTIISEYSLDDAMCANITKDYASLKALDRKQHCATLLAGVLEYIIDDLMHYIDYQKKE